LRLYDSSGSQLASDSPIEANAWITYTPAATGTYYVSAEDDRGSGTQAYAISASQAEPGLVDLDNKRTATLNGVTVRLPTYQELLDIYNSPESNPPHGWEDTATPDYWAADLSPQYTNVHLYLNLAGNTAWTTMPDTQFSVVALQVV
jgi:hypothetical protein